MADLDRIAAVGTGGAGLDFSARPHLPKKVIGLTPDRIRLQRRRRPCYGCVMKRVSLEQFGRQMVELQAAILVWIDGNLQGIAAENRALLRRDARQNRDMGERLAAL